MDLEKAIYQRRTIRRFKQKPIPLEILKKLVDFARVAPMGNNIQSLNYVLVSDAEMREMLFPCLAWAGSLPEGERVPEEDRRPMAYIIVLANTKIKIDPGAEVGAAVENVLLGAVKFGIGTCWMGAINRKKIRSILEIPEFYEIKYVVSLGYPDEDSVMEPFEGSMKYWKDEDGRMHVPKKSLEDVIFNIL